MRNLYCNVEALRKQVFAAVAKLAYEGGDYCSRMEKLPYEIIPGEVGTYRESIFLERAIVGERIRLAMGLPLRDVTEENMISDGVEASAISEKYYDPPLINIIKYACHACPGTHYEVLGQALLSVLPQGRHRAGAWPGPHRSDQMHQVRPLQGGLLLSGHHQVPAALSGGLRHERHRQGPVWPGGHRP